MILLNKSRSAQYSAVVTALVSLIYTSIAAVLQWKIKAIPPLKPSLDDLGRPGEEARRYRFTARINGIDRKSGAWEL